MKVPKSFSIDEDIYKSFEELTDKLNQNRSSIIEDKIKGYLKDNGISDYRTYFLTTNPEYEVTITGEDDAFVFLSDGSKILKTMFKTSFKSVERMDPVDPVSFFRGTPLIIKLLLPNMGKYKITSSFEDEITPQDKLTGRLFKRNDDNRIYRVVEDNTGKWVRLRPQEQSTKVLSHFQDDLNINRDYFLKSYKPYRVAYIDIGGFGFEYIGKSRIDENPIFKLGGGIFIQFFNNDADKLKEYIMNNRNIMVVTNNQSEKYFISINDIEIVPVIKENEDFIDSMDYWKIPTETKTKEQKIEEETQMLNSAINASMKSNIVASEKRNWNKLDDNESTSFGNLTPYEQSLQEDLDKITLEDNINHEEEQKTFISNVLYDMERGIFQREFITSGRIRSFIKSLEKIKTLDPNSDLSKWKYKLLLKIVKYHNEIYG
jgi:hypothetical protein